MIQIFKNNKIGGIKMDRLFEYSDSITRGHRM